MTGLWPEWIKPATVHKPALITTAMAPTVAIDVGAGRQLTGVHAMVEYLDLTELVDSPAGRSCSGSGWYHGQGAQGGMR